MGKPAARLTDMQSGHSCYGPSDCNNAGSTSVHINKKLAMVVGATFTSHCCPKGGCHPPVLSSGSSTVIINGRPAGRLSDPCACGSNVITASSNVIIGG